MANRVELFTLKDDELALLRFLERYPMEVYPRRVPPGWKPFKACPENYEKLPEEDLYLVATDIGPARVDKVKKGKDKGHWRIDEVLSPVIFWGRAKMNEEGELVAGQLWAELDVTPQTGRRNAAPDKLRGVFLEIENFLKKTFRKGDLRGFFVGTHCAREVKRANLKLREDKFFGRLVNVHK